MREVEVECGDVVVDILKVGSGGGLLCEMMESDEK